MNSITEVIQNQVFMTEISIGLVEQESGTSEYFTISSYNDLYQVNSMIDNLISFNENDYLTRQDLVLGLGNFDDLVREFSCRNLVLSFPNDTKNSIMIPLDLFFERPRMDLNMFLEDSRHIINEAFKRSIINSNIILRFNDVTGKYFYLKVSSIMGNLELTEDPLTGQYLFRFQTNLKYPDTFDFSQVVCISNIDQTRFEPFFLTDVQLMAEPELILGGDKVYRLLFKGNLSKGQEK